MKLLVVRVLGVLGFLGVLAMIVTDVLGIVSRPRYDPISDTVSVLAMHRLTGPQDIGLYVAALGCAAVGLGLLLWLRKPALRVVLGVLMVLAGCAIVVLTVSDVHILSDARALRIHVDASLSVGVILLVASILLPFALPRHERVLRLYSVVTAAVLVALVALYSLIPHHLDGIYERLLVIDGLAWMGMVSFALVRGWRPRTI